MRYCLVQEEISAVFQKIANAKGTWNVTDYTDVSLFSDLVQTNVITITIVQIGSASHVLTKDASKYKALVKTCVHSEVQSACSSVLNVETIPASLFLVLGEMSAIHHQIAQRVASLLHHSFQAQRVSRLYHAPVQHRFPLALIVGATPIVQVDLSVTVDSVARDVRITLRVRLVPVIVQETVVAVLQMQNVPVIAVFATTAKRVGILPIAHEGCSVMTEIV